MELPQRCSYYVIKKQRFCKVPPSYGRKFCPHHLHFDPETNSAKGIRVPCPLDSTHYCYLSKLEKHKKKCNAREKEKPVYYKRDINSCDIDCEPQKLFIEDISNENLMKLIQKVEKSYLECIPPITENKITNVLLTSELNNSKCISSEKHLKQQASLLGLLEEQNLLNTSSCIIEFGAGKGQLMYWIIKTVSESSNKTFILVDRETRRYKIDNKFKNDPDVKIERLRIDIQHLYLGGIAAVKSNVDKVVGVSKHLCGAATDLALKCLMETLTYTDINSDDETRICPLGIVMSTCCHHRCKWNLYVGKAFMREQNFSEAEFKIMCIISSWATCGLKKKDKVQTTEADDDQTDDKEIINRYVTLNLPHSKREEIGRMCKHLIDIGRSKYLKDLGMCSKLIYYVNSSVSLENVALVAVCK